MRLRVKEWREAKKMSQVELAARAGVRRATIIEMEKGTTTRVYLDVLDKLAVALGIDAALLIEQVRE